MTTLTTEFVDYALGFDLESRRYGNLIAGETVTGASSVDVVDPATGAVVAQAPVGDARQVDAAVVAARKAAPAWAATKWEERADVVRQVADVVEANADVLARLTTIEQGKPISEARDDVQWSVDFARYFADDARLETQVLRDTPESLIELRHVPVGVVGAICPWNFPLFQAVYKLAPALVTGNTVVLKPSPTTPLATMHLAELLADVVPAGVLNVVGDAGEVGPLLTGHGGVDKISFTGATATGRRVMAAAAADLKRIVLELGGNDAAIVLDDADIAATARDLHRFAFSNSGQVCVSAKRIFASAKVYDALCDELARLTSELVVGHGLEESTQMGPVQNARQFEAAKGYLALAERHGNVVAGGHAMERPGYFIQPTLVRDIVEDNELLTSETFGPVRSVLRYDSIDEAVERANNTEFGLGASVWGADLGRASEVAGRLEAGTVWVNHHFALSPDVPFGGHKQSGVGAEFGAAGLRDLTRERVINIRRS